LRAGSSLAAKSVAVPRSGFGAASQVHGPGWHGTFVDVQAALRWVMKWNQRLSVFWKSVANGKAVQRRNRSYASSSESEFKQHLCVVHSRGTNERRVAKTPLMHILKIGYHCISPALQFSS